MTGVLVLLGIVCFIIVMLLINVKFYISFENEISAQVKYLFFKFNLSRNFKKEKNANTKEYEQSHDDAQGNKEKTSKNIKKKSKVKKLIEEKGVIGFLKIVKNFVVTLKNTSEYLIKHIYVIKFYLDVKICEGDSAQTAIKYGQTCAIVYPAMELIFKNFNIKNYTVRISPDFNGKKSFICFSSIFKIRLIYILKAIFIALFKLIKSFISLKNLKIKEGVKS